MAGYVLNGRKVWVANAEAAEVAIVFAATLRPARAKSSQAQDGASARSSFRSRRPG